MPKFEKTPGIPNPVDVHVGERVRQRRKFLSLSQSFLADSVGLTFQQIQKYERGGNRISASMLHAFSIVLKVPIAYFYQDYRDPGANGGEVEGTFSESASEASVHEFLMTKEGIELAEAFPRIIPAKHRRKILDLVRALAEDETTLNHGGSNDVG